MFHRMFAFAATVIALQGCATQQTVPPGPVEDLNQGIAKTCTPSQPDLSAPAGGSATIAMTNDGWCAVRVKERDGRPFQLGLLRQRPEHGRVLIQSLGGETRIEYTAEGRYTGADRFTVALRPRGGGADVPVQVAVDVAMGEFVAPPAPPPAPSRAPARTPARSSNSSSSRSGSTTRR